MKNSLRLFPSVDPSVNEGEFSKIEDCIYKCLSSKQIGIDEIIFLFCIKNQIEDYKFQIFPFKKLDTETLKELESQAGEKFEYLRGISDPVYPFKELSDEGAASFKKYLLSLQLNIHKEWLSENASNDEIRNISLGVSDFEAIKQGIQANTKFFFTFFDNDKEKYGTFRKISRFPLKKDKISQTKEEVSELKIFLCEINKNIIAEKLDISSDISKNRNVIYNDLKKSIFNYILYNPNKPSGVKDNHFYDKNLKVIQKNDSMLDKHSDTLYYPGSGDDFGNVFEFFNPSKIIFIDPYTELDQLDAEGLQNCINERLRENKKFGPVLEVFDLKKETWLESENENPINKLSAILQFKDKKVEFIFYKSIVGKDYLELKDGVDIILIRAPRFNIMQDHLFDKLSKQGTLVHFTPSFFETPTFYGTEKIFGDTLYLIPNGNDYHIQCFSKDSNFFSTKENRDALYTFQQGFNDWRCDDKDEKLDDLTWLESSTKKLEKIFPNEYQDIVSYMIELTEAFLKESKKRLEESRPFLLESDINHMGKRLEKTEIQLNLIKQEYAPSELKYN